MDWSGGLLPRMRTNVLIATNARIILESDRIGAEFYCHECALMLFYCLECTNFELSWMDWSWGFFATNARILMEAEWIGAGVYCHECTNLIYTEWIGAEVYCHEFSNCF